MQYTKHHDDNKAHHAINWYLVPMINDMIQDNPIITHYVCLPADGVVWCPGTFSQRNYELITESAENSFCSNSYFNDSIRSQFCTCHDSSAVMACAKLWPDWTIIILESPVWYIFFKISIISSQTICTICPRPLVVDAHLGNAFIFIKLHCNHQLLQRFTGKLLGEFMHLTFPITLYVFALFHLGNIPKVS